MKSEFKDGKLHLTRPLSEETNAYKPHEFQNLINNRVKQLEIAQDKVKQLKAEISELMDHAKKIKVEKEEKK